MLLMNRPKTVESTHPTILLRERHEALACLMVAAQVPGVTARIQPIYAKSDAQTLADLEIGNQQSGYEHDTKVSQRASRLFELGADMNAVILTSPSDSNMGPSNQQVETFFNELSSFQFGQQ